MFADEVPESVLVSCSMPWRRATATCSSGCSRWSRRSCRAGDRAIYNSVVTSARAAAALSQAPSRPVRRDDSARAGHRLVHPPLLSIPLASQASRRPRSAAARRCRPARRGQHLLRGCVRRRIRAPGARRDAARQRDQRRVVRPLDRGLAAQPDRLDARARDRAAAAARDEHGHHVGDRARRARVRAAAVVHARHPRGRGHGPRRA